MESTGWREKHLSSDEFNPFNMIDISSKEENIRVAEASGKILLRPKTIRAIREGRVDKGNTLAVAEIAAIQAVKKTPHLIPMCHNIPIGSVDLDFEITDEYVEATCKVSTVSKTGVEMEALTGVSMALLNIWDMVKYLEKDSQGQYPDTRIIDLKILEKRKEKP
jgi:cyclic pyranopterin phosphate synthase